VWNSIHLLSMLLMSWWFLVSRTLGAACLERGGQWGIHEYHLCLNWKDVHFWNRFQYGC
jgi:hypothetical protein